MDSPENNIRLSQYVKNRVAFLEAWPPLDLSSLGLPLTASASFSRIPRQQYLCFVRSQVLSYEDNDSIKIYIYQCGEVHYYCCFTNNHFISCNSYFVVQKYQLCNLHPATKEQRDLLFQKMKEAGYEWDSERKKLKHKR